MHAYEEPTGEKELLYLPNGRHLRAASLGHSSLAADLVYLWAIQYYSNYQRADRYRYVEHVFGNVISELDPYYEDAYSLGALILIVEAGDLEAGLRLLEKGMAENPDNWILPYLAGWECYRAGRYERAARYMDLAAANPAAPPVIARNRAGFVARSGDLRAAYRMWKELHDDPDSDANTRTVAERQMRDLHIRIHIDDLAHGVALFRERSGRLPASLEELIDAGVLVELPVDPDGNPYLYDARTGTVESSAGRVLGDT
jgi:tetratricopeptide (TPR) repeat protein